MVRVLAAPLFHCVYPANIAPNLWDVSQLLARCSVCSGDEESSARSAQPLAQQPRPHAEPHPLWSDGRPMADI